MFKANDRYLIKTPTGYENFVGIQKKIVPDLYTFTFDDETYIKCSGRHLFLTNLGFTKAEDILLELTISGKKISKIEKEEGEFEVYDPVGVENHSTYLSNGVVSHNTEFIGSTATLISGSKLKTLAYSNPIESQEGLDIFIRPQPGRMYIACVDPSEGVEQDYSTINVLDVTESPYVQVAKYRNNKIPLLFLPTIIYSLAKKYNEAFVLIETNSIGKQVVDIMHYDLEYENIYKVEHHHIKGQSISGGFKRAASFGVRTTKSVKKIGCANLKTLVENDKLIIHDFDTIAEMNTFSRYLDTYRAEEGNNDDLVMGLVLFSWLAAQSYFRESTNIDVRKIMLEENNMLVDEDLAPVGIIDNGLQPEEYDDGVDKWNYVEKLGYPTSSL